MQTAQRQSTPCKDCNGTGKIPIVDKRVTLTTGKPNYIKLRCPCCQGTGRAGMRIKI